MVTKKNEKCCEMIVQENKKDKLLQGRLTYTSEINKDLEEYAQNFMKNGVWNDELIKEYKRLREKFNSVNYN